MEFAGEFVVGVRVDLVEHTRRKMVRNDLVLNGVGLALGAFMVALGVWAAALGEVLGGLLAGLVGAGGMWSSIVLLRRTRARRDRWSAEGVSPIAMRLTGEGLWCHLDTVRDGFFLPWHTIAGFHRHGRTRGPVFIDIARGVNPITPGVLGLGSPGVQETLNKRMFGHSGLKYSIEHFDQPLDVIERALAHYSQGRHEISRTEP